MGRYGPGLTTNDVGVNGTIVPIPQNLQNGAVGGRMHADHCIETLRKSIMCQADVSPIFVEKDPNAPALVRADFNVMKKCRNWDKIHHWVRENAVADPWPGS